MGRQAHMRATETSTWDQVVGLFKVSIYALASLRGSGALQTLTRKIHRVQLQNGREPVNARNDHKCPEHENTSQGYPLSISKLQPPYVIDRHHENCCVGYDVGYSISNKDCSKVKARARYCKVPGTRDRAALEYAFNESDEPGSKRAGDSQRKMNSNDQVAVRMPRIHAAILKRRSGNTRQYMTKMAILITANTTT